MSHKRRKTSQYVAQSKHTLSQDRFSLEYEETKFWQTRLAELVSDLDDMFESAVMLKRLYAECRQTILRQHPGSPPEEIQAERAKHNNLIVSAGELRAEYDKLKAETERVENFVSGAKKARLLLTSELPSKRENTILLQHMSCG